MGGSNNIWREISHRTDESIVKQERASDRAIAESSRALLAAHLRSGQHYLTAERARVAAQAARLDPTAIRGGIGTSARSGGTSY